MLTKTLLKHFFYPTTTGITNQVLTLKLVLAIIVISTGSFLDPHSVYAKADSAFQQNVDPVLKTNADPVPDHGSESGSRISSL
jgi:hypothetical protein